MTTSTRKNTGVTPLLQRGDIGLAQVDPVEGHEQGGKRPVMVLSTDRYNRLPSGLVIIVPITTRDRGNPFHLRIEPPHGGLRQTSFILCDQARTISVTRLEQRFGRAPADFLRRAQRLITEFIKE